MRARDAGAHVCRNNLVPLCLSERQAYIFISAALLSFSVHLSVWSPFSPFYICDPILLKGEKVLREGWVERERERDVRTRTMG